MQETSPSRVIAGDLVLVPARVLAVGPRLLLVESEEPADPPEGWPVLVVNAGQRVRLGVPAADEGRELAEAA